MTACIVADCDEADKDFQLFTLKFGDGDDFLDAGWFHWLLKTCGPKLGGVSLAEPSITVCKAHLNDKLDFERQLSKGVGLLPILACDVEGEGEKLYRDFEMSNWKRIKGITTCNDNKSAIIDDENEGNEEEDVEPGPLSELGDGSENVVLDSDAVTTEQVKKLAYINVNSLTDDQKAGLSSQRKSKMLVVRNSDGTKRVFKAAMIKMPRKATSTKQQDEKYGVIKSVYPPSALSKSSNARETKTSDWNDDEDEEPQDAPTFKSPPGGQNANDLKASGKKLRTGATCALTSCPTYGEYLEDTPYFRFPSSPQIYIEWIKALGVAIDEIRGDFLCKSHFHSDDVTADGKNINKCALPLPFKKDGSMPEKRMMFIPMPALQQKSYSATLASTVLSKANSESSTPKAPKLNRPVLVMKSTGEAIKRNDGSLPPTTFLDHSYFDNETNAQSTSSSLQVIATKVNPVANQPSTLSDKSRILLKKLERDRDAKLSIIPVPNMNSKPISIKTKPASKAPPAFLSSFFSTGNLVPITDGEGRWISAADFNKFVAQHKAVMTHLRKKNDDLKQELAKNRILMVKARREAKKLQDKLDKPTARHQRSAVLRASLERLFTPCQAQILAREIKAQEDAEWRAQNPKRSKKAKKEAAEKKKAADGQEPTIEQLEEQRQNEPVEQTPEANEGDPDEQLTESGGVLISRARLDELIRRFKYDLSNVHSLKDHPEYRPGMTIVERERLRTQIKIFHREAFKKKSKFLTAWVATTWGDKDLEIGYTLKHLTSNRVYEYIRSQHWFPFPSVGAIRKAIAQGWSLDPNVRLPNPCEFQNKNEDPEKRRLRRVHGKQLTRPQERKKRYAEEHGLKYHDLNESSTSNSGPTQPKKRKIVRRVKDAQLVGNSAQDIEQAVATIKMEQDHNGTYQVSNFSTRRKISMGNEESSGDEVDNDRELEDLLERAVHGIEQPVTIATTNGDHTQTIVSLPQGQQQLIPTGQQWQAVPVTQVIIEQGGYQYATPAGNVTMVTQGTRRSARANRAAQEIIHPPYM